MVMIHEQVPEKHIIEIRDDAGERIGEQEIIKMVWRTVERPDGFIAPVGDLPPLFNPLSAKAIREAEFPNLQPDQFWFGLRAAGYEDDVRAWVATLNDPDSPDYDPVAWAWASSKMEFATFFERDHPLVESFREAMEMPEAELDALWKFAAGI